jgi:intein/homing endonuclease
MADGRNRPIRDIAVGDSVLSYNEMTSSVEPNRVQRVRLGSATPMLELTWGAGISVRVTPVHKFATPRGWVRAGDLRTGDVLLRLKGNHIGSTVLAQVQPVMPDGFVYDLEVDVAHTYFAQGALVHNKNA